jgi:hypothetical protein
LGEALACQRSHGNAETPLHCRCSATVAAGGVVTPAGQYVPFMAAAPPAPSLVQRLRARRRVAGTAVGARSAPARARRTGNYAPALERARASVPVAAALSAAAMRDEPAVTAPSV